MIRLLWLSALCATATAAGRTCSPSVVTDQLNRFDFPAPKCNPDNYTGVNTYPVGTKLTIRWATRQPRISLILWQAGNSGVGTGTLLFNVSSADHTSYDFSGYPPQPLSGGNTFFFAVYVPGQGAELFSSDYFNLTDSSSSSSTSSASSTSTSTSNSTSIPTPSPQPSPSSDAGKYIGIGIGIGIACSLLTGLILLYIFSRRLKSARQNPAFTLYQPASPSAHDRMAVPGSTQYGPKYPYTYSQQTPAVYPSEMEHSRDRYAMLGDVPGQDGKRIELHGRYVAELPSRMSTLDGRVR